MKKTIMLEATNLWHRNKFRIGYATSKEILCGILFRDKLEFTNNNCTRLTKG